MARATQLEQDRVGVQSQVIRIPDFIPNHGFSAGLQTLLSEWRVHFCSQSEESVVQGGKAQCKGWRVGSAGSRVWKTQPVSPALLYGASEPNRQNKF